MTIWRKIALTCLSKQMERLSEENVPWALFSQDWKNCTLFRCFHCVSWIRRIREEGFSFEGLCGVCNWCFCKVLPWRGWLKSLCWIASFYAISSAPSPCCPERGSVTVFAWTSTFSWSIMGSYNIKMDTYWHICIEV